MSEEKKRSRGTPFVSFRLEPKALEELKRRAGEAHGRAGGVALYLRRLVYDHLGMEMPLQYGDLGRSSAKRKAATSNTQVPASATRDDPGAPQQDRG